eukprot:Tbor_TRINITY_DN5570_c3_g2::TRINITY_DN5570_c3_g2_i1::g.13896::m.13896/K17086/TM9SF2_4; transmembrane 9 superfamily member 2/4
MMLLKILAVVTLASSVAVGLRFPGINPIGYTPGQNLTIRVSSLTSNRGVFPYPFYSIPQCKPSKKRFEREKKRENLGEIIMGSKNQPSQYFVKVLQNISCQKVCDLIDISGKETEKLVKRINGMYRGNMILDGLPVAQKSISGKYSDRVMVGYPLGIPAKISPSKQPLINNHLHFTVLFNEPDSHTDQNEETFRIVGFTATAHSIKYENPNTECDMKKTFDPTSFDALPAKSKKLTYTYSVTWIPSPDIPWATRWDVYLKGSIIDKRIHWLSLLNSSIAVLSLAALLATILVRTLSRDIKHCNEIIADESENEVKWKLVHGDVFRAPNYPVLISLIVASGVQIFLISAGTLVIALSGFLNPQNRGSLVTVMIMCFVIVSFFSGFVGARLLKFFKCQAWKNVFAMGLFIPGIYMTLYIFLNFIHWAKHASSAIPFLYLMTLFALWLLCSIPLTILGGHAGFHTNVINTPCYVNTIPRLIPSKTSTPTWLIILGSGFLPFAAAFIELVYIMSSFWQGRVYYVFGFLSVVFVLVSICCAEISVSLTYLQLCKEDYRWWWNSIGFGSSTGLYMLLWSIYYLCVNLSIRQPSSIALYIGYMLIGSSMFSLMMAAVSFLSSFLLVRIIYSAVKVE